MALTTECLERLQLNLQPFAASAREAFLYKDTLLDTQIERMLRALEKPGAILLLSASSRAGRSTQLMRLLGAMPRHFEIVAFRGRSNTTFASVDVTIRKHLAAHGDDDRSRSLNDLMIERGKRGTDMLIAVDDAHLLGSGILRQLLKLGEDVSAASPIGPRLLLMGDAVLGRNYQRTLDTEDNRLVQHISLAPFNQEQSAAYLHHRLAAAGNANLADLFKPEIIANLHQRSRGLPGDLNEVAEEWLSDYCDNLAYKDLNGTPPPEDSDEDSAQEPDEPADEPKDEDGNPDNEEAEQPQDTEDPAISDRPADQNATKAVTDDTPVAKPDQSEPTIGSEPKSRKAAFAFWKQPWFLPTVTGIGLVALILSIGLNLPENNSGPSSLPLRPQQPDRDNPGGANQAATEAETPAPDTAQQDPDTATVASPMENDQVTDLTADMASATAADEEITEPQGAANPRAQTSEGAKDSPPQPAPAQAGATEPSQQTPAVTEEPSTPSSPPQTGTTAPSAQGDGQTPKNSTDQAATDGTEQPTPAERLPEPPKDYQKARTRNDLLWLAEQNPEHLTIQLIALRKFAAVEDYLQTHGIEDANIIPDGPLVIAIYGSYPDMESTMAGLSSLPTEVIAQGYWIRTIGDVRKDARR
ncbi:AAA family ATPase [Thiorhodovibrio frisius]|uniref:ORC1/DEAH AAA+ ATPase domain-containing protein n=1 Tax=Thiorhodovibrio frisius TaxID=631362 RepID=H8Z4H9_9GAMM|nr:AAA family ATPase [Thiorhodovibrio frisius]EIC20236.1 hypothetical protein Thi970DRAFT_03860 [Thiorhodovibrio frisius]WPL20973.1 putative secretion ATPase, PEP-CTERM locus subfamily [Thiorhodovibrio frisius]